MPFGELVPWIAAGGVVLALVAYGGDIAATLKRITPTPASTTPKKTDDRSEWLASLLAMRDKLEDEGLAAEVAKVDELILVAVRRR